MTQDTQKITLPYQWAARIYQQPLWNYLRAGGKRAVANWHRRAGKDEAFLHHTACAAHERIGNYWYMLPQYAQARKSMWDSINPHSGKRRIDEAFPAAIRKRTLEQEMVIHFHSGSTFQLVGSDNYNSLVGSPPVGLIFSEYALSDPSAWAYLMPILEENGGWAAFNGTPRGKNHYHGLCRLAKKTPGWFYQELNAEQTGVFSPEQLAAILAQLQEMHGEDFGRALYLQEYFNSFEAAIPGSVFGEWIDRAKARGRIGEIAWERAADVDTAWDLGRTDATAIWFFQIVGGEIRILDYHESTLKDIAFYGSLLREKAQRLGLNYGVHWLPHDAKARLLAAGGKTIRQQLQEEDVGRVIVTRRLDHQDAIQAARATFPHCHFDAGRCEKGLEALRHYHYLWDQENRVYTIEPEHDWSSHGASAFRTLAQCWKLPKAARPEAGVVSRLISEMPLAMTMGQLRERHFKAMRAKRRPDMKLNSQ